MKLNEFEKIKNMKYSPKEALAYFILTIKYSQEKNINSLVATLKEELVGNTNKSNLIDRVKWTSIQRITNYWSLSIEQVIAYGYVVFNSLIFEEKNFTEEQVTDMFIYVMRLYSPDNAVEFATNKLNKSTN